MLPVLASPGARATGKVIRVAFPLYQGVTLLDFAGATQVFAFAGTDDISFEVVWLRPRIESVLTTENVCVLPTHTFDNHPPIDVLFVPGGGRDGVVGAMFDDSFQRFLREAGAGASWVGSVCSGAFILAAARLLDGCRATTYWSVVPALALLEDKMGIRAALGHPRFVIEEEKRRFTGGGVSSSIDLALELVLRLTNREAAEEAQLTIQYAPDPPVRAGDPCQASPDLVAQVEKEQHEGFVVPIRRAVERLLAAE